MTTTTATPTSTRQSAMNARVADVIAHQLASLPEEEQARVLAVLETNPPEVVLLPNGRAEVRVEGRRWATMTTHYLLDGGQWQPAPVPLIVVDLARDVASKLDPEFDRFAEAIAADPGAVEYEIDPDGLCHVYVTTTEGREWMLEIPVADLLPPAR